MAPPPLDHLVPLAELEDESGGRVVLSVAHAQSAELGDISARRGDLGWSI
jgi:hypothetical protein